MTSGHEGDEPGPERGSAPSEDALPAEPPPLLGWREAGARVAGALRAQPRWALAWALPALLLWTQQATRLLGGSRGGESAWALLLLLGGGAAAASLAARDPEASPARVLRRTWWAALLASAGWLVLVNVPPLEAALARPRPGRWLVVPTLALGAAWAVLGRDLRAAWRARGPRVRAALWVGAGAWGAVCAGETAARLGHPEAVIGAGALGLNVLALAAAGAAVLALSRRPLAAGVLPILALAFLHTANLLKLRFLREPLSPHDLDVLGDLGRLDLVGPVHLVGAALALLALGVALARTRPLALRPGGRALLGGAALILVAGLVHGYRVEPLRRGLGALGVYPRTANALRSSLENGLLVELLCEAHALRMPAPADYSEARVRQVLEHYRAPARQRPAPPVNVVVYLMEAFCDPTALGFEFSADPIPVFRRLRAEGGALEVVSPVFGGLSANAEFELLTGLSMAFLPRDSCPYRQYVHRALPALPAALRGQGYRTYAFHSESLNYYDYARVYPLLGFEHAVSLAEVPGVPRDASGRRPADAALVQALLQGTAGLDAPFFAFAFPNQTHWPWSPAFVARHGIRVMTPMDPEDARALEGYVNALRASDEALGQLIEGLAARGEPTLVVALGDHLPALSPAAFAAGGAELRYRIQGGLLDLEGGVAELERCYTVPGVVWSNLPHEPGDARLSMNYLGAWALEQAGVALPPPLAANAGLRERLPVLGRFVVGPDGVARLPTELAGEAAEVAEDYRVLQYDQLFGAGFANER